MASELTPDPFEELSASPPPTPSNSKKTWQELRQAVKKTRKLQTLLANRVPHTFTFKHIETDSGLQTRIYFLGIPPGSRENTLLYVDVPYDAKLAEEPLQWQPLLDSFHATPLFGQFSKEEQLLRERKRLGSFGITSYDYDLEQGKFVFTACNSLFRCVDTLGETGFMTQPVFPTEVKSSSCVTTRLDPKLCPNNPDLLGFISGNDIWLTNLHTTQEFRLTFAHKGVKNLADDPLSAGVPSFVVQEEFDRYTGYWWQPKLTQSSGQPVVYRILYEEVDESEVEILHIVSTTSDERGYDEYRYPRAGTPNAKCTLKMLEFTLDENGAIQTVYDKQLAESLSSLFPWMEYILRAGWTPDGQFVYASLLDRKQQKLQLILIPVECFSQSATEDEANGSMHTDVRCTVYVIQEDTSDIWINVHDIIHFFPRKSCDEISFIWASEKTGFRHLYNVTSRLQYSHNCHMDTSTDVEDTHADLLRPCILHEEVLTSGEWEVSRKEIWVDEHRKLVYFIGLKDSPLETHLYVVSYENPGSIVRLTELGYSHSIAIDKECSLFVTVYSSISRAPSSQIYKLVFTDQNTVVPQAMGCLLQATTLSDDYHPPELFSYSSQVGHTAYGMMYKPQEMEAGKLYPTILFVYGGPQVQLVGNAFKGTRFLRLHTLASLGYVVVVIDTRGSCHRGIQFESHIKERLGTVEIEDQIEGLYWLASVTDFIDLNRVAIHGWSYGGYLSLMGLAQRPDAFKVAVAGAPVTTWTLYDTGYTERYMDLPQVNQEGYKNGSVLDYTDRFPSEENRLLIVHGLIDENVHFFHTSLLVNALIKACKPYQLQVYPNERHGIRNAEASEHYETMVLSFLQQNL